MGRCCARGGWKHFGGPAAIGVVLGACAGSCVAREPPVVDRGELLYATHCSACHGEQLHWRNAKVASDWPRLKTEVRRWQAAAGLRWSEDDIVAVARYLNETIYHLPQTGDAVGGVPASQTAARAAAPSRWRR